MESVDRRLNGAILAGRGCANARHPTVELSHSDESDPEPAISLNLSIAILS
jgi:hypothetical protein